MLTLHGFCIIQIGMLIATITSNRHLGMSICTFIIAISIAIEILFSSITILRLFETEKVPASYHPFLYLIKIFPAYHYSKLFNELETFVIPYFDVKE